MARPIVGVGHRETVPRIGYDEDLSGGPLGAAFTTNHQPVRKPASRRQSITMMFGCTLLGAAGQILIKHGLGSVPPPTTWWGAILAMILAMFTNPPVLTGYILYALMTALFVFVLRSEELSIVYPIISLTYVWVTALSAVVFRESMNLPRLVGVATIVLGVGVLGRDPRK